MASEFTLLDSIIFIVTLVSIMGIGFYAARKEETKEDYFLAGKTIRWWAVAGSVFGTNVSANHLVGMLGIGYSIGFAQSHFELGAVFALMLLCYGFLPVYRKLNIFTLSEYLGKRYDNNSRMLYTVILIVLVMVQLTAGFYIGSRSLMLLLKGSAVQPGYVTGILILAFITAAYTIFGGLKAVIYTDFIQSMLLLAAGILVAVLTFAQPEVGGWAGMITRDAALPALQQKMHLYLPSNHPDLPWSGALSGLIILHLFYWSTNQYVVQRALGAQSDSEARLGIITAGFLKLLIPFFAIAGGIAAAQLFDARLGAHAIDPDAALPELIKLVIPVGYGLFGVILAGLIGAILSSIDSMMNSISTLITFDLYRELFDPGADDKRLILVGRIAIVAIVTVSAFLAIMTYSPQSKGNFFLKVSSLSGHFTPGLVVVFFSGMFWRRATAKGSVAAIITAPLFSFTFEWFYNTYLGQITLLQQYLGPNINFMHRVFVTVIVCALVNWFVSKKTGRETGDSDYTFMAVFSNMGKGTVFRTFRAVFIVVLVSLFIGLLVYKGILNPKIAAVLAGFTALLPFGRWLKEVYREEGLRAVCVSDRLWAGLLCALTMGMMFYYF